jgi:uncharacterized protein DUF5681
MTKPKPPEEHKPNPAQWKPGQSGNPAGRRVNSRNRLSEQFLKDMVEDWEAHGKAAIVTFRTDRPHDYVKVVATLVPRQFSLKINELEELSDAELDRQLAAVLAQLAADGALPGTGEAKAAEPQAADPIPTLQ